MGKLKERKIAARERRQEALNRKNTTVETTKKALVSKEKVTEKETIKKKRGRPSKVVSEKKKQEGLKKLTGSRSKKNVK